MATTRKESTQPTNGKEEALARNLPVFYQDPHPITLERHGFAGLNPSPKLGFTRDTNSVPVTVVEFFEAARSYPIVFTTGAKPLPIALVGIEPKNYFLQPDDLWKKGCYIPAYVRRYPFILMEVPTMQQWVLCIDEASPQFASLKPEQKLYQEDQKPSELSQNALEFCRSYQAHYEMTEAFCAAIVEAGLLEEKATEMLLPDKTKYNLHGFQLLSEEKFHALPETTIMQWYRKGWIGLVYAILMSYNNWKYMSVLASEHHQANTAQA